MVMILLKYKQGVTRDTLRKGDDFMNEIKVRNVDSVVVKKLDELAKKHHMSRNEYLKQYLKRIAIVQDVQDLDNRYRELVDILAQRLEQCNDVIEENSITLEKTTDVLEKIMKADNGGENYIS